MLRGARGLARSRRAGEVAQGSRAGEGSLGGNSGRPDPGAWRRPSGRPAVRPSVELLRPAAARREYRTGAAVRWRSVARLAAAVDGPGGGATTAASDRPDRLDTIHGRRDCRAAGCAGPE